ncbi:MAG: TonB-dependent receptor [Alphaproteobacteria bacterium]|nr:MAG: TonB-dependent receptor [Alphaproteobacteria bacterium]
MSGKLFATAIMAPACMTGMLSMASAQAVLDEIVVTARKTVETLDDVPISVSVTQGDKIERLSIGRLEDLSEFVPNLQINENATQQTVTIRGIGSGANQAFEQSVGTYVDGVYFGRGRSARNPFFDVERVEVLKGPQGILFGKNTIAGAINITTRKPTNEFEGFAEAEYFTDVERFSVSGAVSAPISENISARLAATYSTQDGYVFNSFTQNEEEERDEFTVRGIVVFDVNEDLVITLKGEVSSYNVDGRTAQNVQAGPLEGLYLAIDPTFESDLDFRKSTVGDDFDNTDSENLTATVEYDIDDDWSLTSITAYVGYDFNNNIGAEFAPLDYVDQSNFQEHEQISQELRVHYQSTGPLEFIGGLYFGSEDLKIDESFNFNLVNLIDLGVAIFPLQASTVTNFNQDTDSYAVFGEFRYDITQKLTASIGMRYTEDKKSVDKQLVVAELGTQIPAPGQEPLAAIVGRIPHSYQLSLSRPPLAFNISSMTMPWSTAPIQRASRPVVSTPKIQPAISILPRSSPKRLKPSKLAENLPWPREPPRSISPISITTTATCRLRPSMA